MANQTGTGMLRVIVLVGVLVLMFAFVSCSPDDEASGDVPPDPTATPIEPASDSDDVSGSVTPDFGDPTPDTGDQEIDTPTPTPTPTEPVVVETPTPEGALARLQGLNIALEFVADGFIQPTDLVPATDGTERLFVVSRTGVIHVLENGEVREEPFLDIRDQVTHEMVEQGMLSMALHPRFAENHYFYVNYIDVDGNTMISRFEASEDGQRAVQESETPILPIEQPHYSHNGGNLTFGPDGYLYIGIGDGEDPGDPHGNAQDPSTLLGAVLRIDVDAGEPYAIPPDNPFVGDDALRDEVWVYGLRNPWRFSFHPISNDLYLVDVGQWAVEEVNVQPAESPGGENYGWPILEGDQCWEAETCETEGLTMPVATYTNPDGGCAVIGGYHFYGAENPQLEGVYLFGDWCSGKIWGMLLENGEWVYDVLLESELMINGFGLDQHGEIYVLDFESGGVYQVIAY